MMRQIGWAGKARAAACARAANRSLLVADLLEKPVCGNLCPQTLRSRFLINGCGHALELSAYCTHIQEECRLFVVSTALHAPRDEVNESRHIDDVRRKRELRHQRPVLQRTGD